MDDNRSRVEIHPKEGLKMDLVTDRWIRVCIGVSLLLVSLGCLLLAATPLVKVLAS